MQFRVCLCIVVSIFFLNSCASFFNKKPSVDEDLSSKDGENIQQVNYTSPFIVEEYKLSYGDIINIEVYGEPDLKRENIFIPQSGLINYPFIDEVNLLNMSTKEASENIGLKLKEGFFYNPQVGVSISKYKPIIVSGAIEEPGIYDFEPGLTYRMLFIIAGGEGHTWSSDSISVRRGNSNNLRPNDIDEAVAPGDLVIFESNKGMSGFAEAGSGVFFIDGEVRSPGKYEFETTLTVEQAIILAGGVTNFGSKRRLYMRDPEDKVKMQKVKLTTPIKSGSVILVKARIF